MAERLKGAGAILSTTAAWFMPLDRPVDSLPVVLVGPAPNTSARYLALRRAAASALSLADNLVTIGRDGNGAPFVARPERSGLHVSLAARGAFAAISLAGSPVGVDIEIAGPQPEPPWNILHPDEREWLARLAAEARGEAFLRLWTVKEAYLKALRTGLAREPASFAVHLDGERASIADPRGQRQARAESRRLALGHAGVIVAIVVLA